MNTFTKRLLAIAILVCIVAEAWADRGVGRKTKSRTTLNISAPTNNLRTSIAFNIKTGLSYKGTLLNTRQTVGSSIMNSSVVTYQKGNTTYIIPYKNKIAMPDVQPNYTGMKIILRKK